MNGTKYLLDTNAVITALNEGISLPAADYLVSIITEMELLSFSELTESDEYLIIRLLEKVRIIGLTHDVKTQAIRIRRQTKLKLPDSIICATALSEEAVLVTDDMQMHGMGACDTKKLSDLLSSDLSND